MAVAQSKKSKRVSFGSCPRFNYDNPNRLKELERGFVLDGVCLSHLANNETDRTFPSLNIGIPQYNALVDRNASNYFKRKGLPGFVTDREDGDKKEDKQSSMQGRVIDKFCATSEAEVYLTTKQREGAGCARQVWGGHTSIPTDPTVVGWNSEDGYRRNTFDLRRRRSVFDYNDPFDNPRQFNSTRQRTQSAPATIRLMRQKSASVYRSHPGGGRRAMSAMPRPMTGRPLAARTSDITLPPVQNS